MSIELAHRMTKMTASAVREILKVAERPEVLSFAGGLPAPELFPIQAIAEAHEQVFAKDGAAALQYSVTEGFAPLREWIVQRLASRGVRATVENTLITCGSQQGIDLSARVLVNPGDVVAVESPGYLAALQTFGGFEARFAVVESDDEGMRTDSLERVLAAGPVRLIYVVPNFNNPKGTTLSLERRRALVALAQKHRVPIVEDDPYGELRFRGEPLPPLAALDEDGLVIHLGTFSKTLAPGLRIGWAVGSRHLIRAMTVAKQASDLHTATLAQRATAQLLSTFDYEAHLVRLRQVYGGRCDTMLRSLADTFPAGTRWTKPEGGMFTWVQLPHGLKAETCFDAALAERVAFVPGSAFYAQEKRHDFLRLNFSNRSSELITEGMQRLGTVVERVLARG